MSDQIKYIVQKLNQPPFNQKLNLISFDSLRSEQLLQILNDVFTEIDPKMKSDIRSEDPEQTAVKMLGFLRILKYKPPSDVDMSAFRQGIVTGNKDTIHHILEWALTRLPELIKRAYLARFLVKIELAPDIEGDSDVQDLFQEYEHLIEEFKEFHKQYEQVQNSGYSTQEIRKDLTHMEEERDQLSKKIERLKRKVESHPRKEAMLTIAKKLREEKDKAMQQGKQKLEQKNLMSHVEQKITRLHQQLKELKHAGLGASPEGIIQKLEEETKVNAYLIKEKLPKEIASKTRYNEDMQKVAHEPAMGRTDLDQLHAKIQIVNSETNQLIEKRMMSQDPIDDKLSLFRQQAAIVGRKKEGAAEQLNELRTELNHLIEELREKKEELKGFNGEEVLRGDEFKRYVNKLRSKSTIYKKKRQELAEFRAEIGVLARTEEILQNKERSVSENLSSMEEQQGIEGYHTTQEELEKVSSVKAQLDEQKGQTLEEMATMVRRLNAKIAEKKARLAPIIKELRPLRQESQDMTLVYDQKKASYDSCAAGLESNISKLEQEVTSIKDEVIQDESKYHILKCNVEILDFQEHRMADEIKMYVSSDPQEKKKSMREQLTRLIQEQEQMSKHLKDQRVEVKDNHEVKQKQMRMWSDVQQLMECKKKCWQKKMANKRGGGATTGASTSDRLVL